MIPTELPTEMSGFADYGQWIVWRLEPGEPKPAKVPFSPATGFPSNPHDPANWMSYRGAADAANALGCGVGFVFTAADPFFFVDVDHAWDGEQWSETAQQVFASFPGAAFEISQSGTGFHLFGRYREALPHAHRRDDIGLELYTAGRFVAMTLRDVAGGWPDLTAHYEAFAREWMPERVDSSAVEWSDQAVDGWSGPEDDDELIQKMLGQRESAAAAFGQRATLRQLWEGDEALGQFFPDGDAGRAFDHSSADLALLAKLAFYTGKNAERMDRLFRRSALYRDKWETRDDYRVRSVSQAIAFCNRVMGERREEAPPTDLPTQPSGEENPRIQAAYQYLAPDQQLDYFAGCVYVTDRHQVMTPKGTFLNPPQFKTAFGGYVFAMDAESNDSTKNAFEAFTESRAIRWDKVDSTTFRPEDPPGTIYEESGLRLLNSYVPIPVESEPGDASPFLGLLAAQLPDERNRLILLSYAAAILQYPGVKFQWCPVIQGVQGNGKSFVMRVIALAVGRRYYHFPKSSDIDNKFNAWLREKLFIGVEEIRTTDPAVEEALKDMITNPEIEIQGKGADQVTENNRANFIMCSNHKDAVRKTADDRRYCPLFTDQQSFEDLARCGMSGEYFPQLYRWLHSGGHRYVTHYLRNFEIPEEFNPATSCHRAPVSTSTAEAISLSVPYGQQIIQEAIDEGRAGFRGGYISSTYLSMLSKENRLSRRAVRDALDAIAYVPHPGLRGGRVPSALASEENRKPTIFVRSGSLQCNLEGQRAVTAYLDAQQAPNQPGGNRASG